MTMNWIWYDAVAYSLLNLINVFWHTKLYNFRDDWKNRDPVPAICLRSFCKGKEETKTRFNLVLMSFNARNLLPTHLFCCLLASTTLRFSNESILLPSRLEWTRSEAHLGDLIDAVGRLFESRWSRRGLRQECWVDGRRAADEKTTSLHRAHFFHQFLHDLTHENVDGILLVIASTLIHYWYKMNSKIRLNTN